MDNDNLEKGTMFPLHLLPNRISRGPRHRDDRAYYLYLLHHGHRNAPRAYAEPTIYGSEVNHSYFRTNLTLIRELAQEAVPDNILNKVCELYHWVRDPERVKSMMMVTLHAGADVIALFNGKKVKLNPVTGTIPRNSDLLVFDIDHLRSMSILSELQHLGGNAECMVRYQHQASGVCFFWLFYWNMYTRKCGHSVLENLPLCNLGYVPTRMQLNQVILDKGSEFILSRVGKQIIEPLSDDEYNEKKSQIMGVDKEGHADGERVFIAAVQYLINLMSQSLEKRPDRLRFERLMSHNVFCHWDEQVGLHKWVRVFESLCELSALMLDINVLHSGPSLSQVVKGLVDPNKRFEHTLEIRLYPYSMTVLTDLMLNQLSSLSPPNRIVTTSQSYYESSQLSQYFSELHQECVYEYVRSSIDIEGKVDLLIIESHPHNPNSDTQFPQDIAYHVLRLLKENDQLSVIVDVTMDFYEDPVFREMINQLQQPILEGRLNLYLFQSCAKLLQMGTDLFAGGLLLHFGKHRLPTQSKCMKIPKLEKYLGWFLYLFKSAIQKYCHVIRHNNRLLEQVLQDGLSKDSLVLTPNSDVASAYFALKLADRFSLDKVQYLQMCLELIFERCIPNGLHIDDRYSFGFSTTNLNLTKESIRISCGVESDEMIIRLADQVVALSDVLDVIRSYVEATEAKRYRFDCLVRELYVHQAFQFTIELDVSIEIGPYVNEIISQPANLRVEGKKLFLTVKSQDSSEVLERDLSLYEVLRLCAWHRFGHDKHMQITIEGPNIRISLLDNNRYLFSDNPVLEQLDVECQAEVELDALLGLSIKWGEQIYRSNQIMVHHKDSGKLWVPVSGLSIKDVKRLLKRMKARHFKIKYHDDQSSIKLYFCLIRSNRVEHLQKMYWARLSDLQKYAENTSVLLGLKTPDSHRQFMGVLERKLMDRHWLPGEIHTVRKEDGSYHTILGCFIRQYLYTDQNDLHQDFRLIFPKTNTDMCFDNWLHEFRDCARYGEEWMPEKFDQQVMYIEHHLTPGSLLESHFRDKELRALKDIIGYDDRIVPVYHRVMQRFVRHMVEKLKDAFVVWVVPLMNVILSRSFEEPYHHQLIELIESSPQKSQLFESNDIYDTRLHPYWGEEVHNYDDYIIVGDTNREQLKQLLSDVGLVNQVPPKSRWAEIAKLF